MYTAYVALQYLPPQAVIEVGSELLLVQPGSSVASLRQGQQLTVETLIEGMLLPSGNDAAYILAAAAGRVVLNDSTCGAAEAIKAFVGAMNDRAEADGLRNTHFANPDGYHHDQHYSSMADLIVIAQLALDHEIIVKYTGLHSDTVRLETGESLTWKNTNLLLDPRSAYYREGVIGLKTGYTDEAGHCLLSAKKRGDAFIIIGVFGCASHQQRFEDTLALWDRLS